MEDVEINCGEAEKVDQAVRDQLDDISFGEAKIKKKGQVKTLGVLKMGVKSKYVKKVCKACIVFDWYDNGLCIKDREHERRTEKMSAFVSLNELQMIPTCRNIFEERPKQSSIHIYLIQRIKKRS